MEQSEYKSKIYFLDAISDAGKRAHIKLKNGEEFNCRPDCIIPDDDTWEDIMVVWQEPFHVGLELKENEIETVEVLMD